MAKKSRTQNALSTGKKLANDDRVTFRGDGDDDHLAAGTLFDLVHDVATFDRQLVVRTAAGDILGPARHVQVDRFALVEDVREADEVRDRVTVTDDTAGVVHFRTAVDVARAESNRINSGHDIELGQDERRSVHLYRIFQRYEIEPTSATRTTSGGTELIPLHTNADTEVILGRYRQGGRPLLVLSIQSLERTERLELKCMRHETLCTVLFAVRPTHFRWERTTTDTRHVRRLSDAKDMVEVLRLETTTEDESSGAGITRSLEPGGSMTDSQEQALSTFGHHRLVVFHDVTHQDTHVRDVLAQRFCPTTTGINYLVDVDDRVRVEEVLRTEVRICENLRGQISVERSTKQLQ